MTNWQTTAERLCRVVCPDLQGVPVYLVSYDEIRAYESRLCVDGFAAWTSAFCDLTLCHHLNESGRWRGRGFAAAVDLAKVPTLQDTLGTVLHELGHWLTFDQPSDESNPTSKRDAADSRRIELDLGAAALQAVDDRWTSPAETVPLPPWHGHEADFVRAACHLARRTEGEIESVRPRHICFARPYYRPPFSELTFMRSLRAELSDPRPIRDILASDPPEEFSEVYALATGWFDATDPTALKTE